MSLLNRLSIAVALLLCACALWAGALPETTPEQVGVSPQRLERFSAMLQQAVDSGELPGAAAVIARKGKIFYQKTFGMQDKANKVPMAADSIFRIYSMTKPLVSVGALILVEEGKLGLHEPISKYLPEFKDMTVGVEGMDGTGVPIFYTVPAKRQISVQDLLRHTSGLTYGNFTPGRYKVQQMYRDAGIFSQKWVLADFTKALAKIPLVHEPGTTWEYGHSSDVLGRVIEVASGQTLDVFLRERLFAPLKMNDTGFDVPTDKHKRIAQPQADPKTGQVPELIDVSKPATLFAGGHGAVSTPGDYLRFCQMLLNGGELEGARILGPKTVAFMTSNHMTPNINPGNLYLPTPGYGFGLGFAVRKETGLAEWPGSPGEYFWGGYAGTYFWIDPKEQLIPVLMVQEPNRRQHYRVLMRDLVYQALME
jgi:CubicO group peptidase (beta-lactamase class C family)